MIARVGTRGPGWIQTYSGEAFYPLDPRPEEIHKWDIRHALWNVGRFTGHTRRFYSVGEHSARVAALAESMNEKFVPFRALQLAALYHDGSEAYLADIATPVKISEVFEGYRAAEFKLQRMIDARLWEHWCQGEGQINAIRDLVKKADAVALALEASFFCGVRDVEARWGFKIPEGVDLEACHRVFVKQSKLQCRALWESI